MPGPAADIDEARAPSAPAHVAGRAFIDLHCHTSASFDSLADPAKVVRAAAARGLTHLVVSDHDRIETLEHAIGELVVDGAPNQ